MAVRISYIAGGLIVAGLSSATSAGAQSLPSPYTEATRYDDARRVVGTIAPDPDGNGALHFAAVRNTYDALGRLTSSESGELATWQSEAVDPANWVGFTVLKQVNTTYDGLNRRILEVISSNGTAYAATQYSYDGVGRPECTAERMFTPSYQPGNVYLPTSACALILPTPGSAEPDRITRNIYNAAGQLLTVQKAYGVTTANGFPVTLQQDYQSYGYTPNGKQSYVIDANGNKTGYGYDGFDRQDKWYFPSTTAPGAASTTDFEQYGYDANGNRTSLRKRDGRTINYTYDALNRITLKAFVNAGACVSGYACTTPPSSSARDVYYSYDLRGLQTSARFDSATGVDALTNAFDGFGRKTSSTISMGGVSRTIGHEYDADGNSISITQPDNVYFVYDYDGLDRMIDVKQNGGAQIASFVYGPRGTQSSSNRGPVATAYTFDPLTRIESISDHFPGTPSADVSTTLQYNPADQIVSQTRSNDAYSFTDYVLASNGYVANGLNQYTTVGAGSLGYDSNGNLASNGGTSFTYDVENRLISAAGTLNTTMIYDPSGRLYQIISPTISHQFAYDGDQVVVDYNGTGFGRYVYGPGEDNPLIWYLGTSLLHPYPLQKDSRGSIISIANQDGALRFINTYDEYGVPGSANVGLFQYTGQMYLPDLGMYYYKARIYSARLGRFLQTDPIGYRDQMDLYAYVGNDPIDGRDPSGQHVLVASLPEIGEAAAAICTGPQAVGCAIVGGVVVVGAAGYLCYEYCGRIFHHDAPPPPPPPNTDPNNSSSSSAAGAPPPPDPDREKAKDRRARQQQAAKDARAGRAGGESDTNGTPGTLSNNQAQKKAFDSIVRDEGLSPEQARELHEEITKRDMSRSEILERARELFPK